MKLSQALAISIRREEQTPYAGLVGIFDIFPKLDMNVIQEITLILIYPVMTYPDHDKYPDNDHIPIRICIPLGGYTGLDYHRK